MTKSGDPVKQNVRKAAAEGIHEYHTDTTAVRDKEREDTEAFACEYTKQLDEEMMADYRTMLSGIDPYTGARYTSSEYRTIIDSLELTQDELFDAHRTMDDIILGETGDANIDAMIAAHGESLRYWK